MRRKFSLLLAAAIILSFYGFNSWRKELLQSELRQRYSSTGSSGVRRKSASEHYPVTSFTFIPPGLPVEIPKIQHPFGREDHQAKAVRLARQTTVRGNFLHAWKGYTDHAWGKDQVAPLSGEPKTTFNGWGVTLVDSLDTLWIMDFKDEFGKAVDHVSTLNFTISTDEELNVFETNIRYLGGMLSAFDLSGYPVLLRKAIELGDVLLLAFNTLNGMPVTRLKWKDAANGTQEAGEWVSSAEIGTLSLEFTRLSQLSGDSKYFDAIQIVTDTLQHNQNYTAFPGMWPKWINARDNDFKESKEFTLGGLADSLYEYLPKQWMLLGGRRFEYRQMYERAIGVAKEILFFRPLNPQNLDILLSGTATVIDGKAELDPHAKHLACFIGGMVALAAKIFNNPADLPIAEKLTYGCIWAYESTASGIMPDSFHAAKCPNGSNTCQWDEKLWHDAIVAENLGAEERIPGDLIRENSLPAGFIAIDNPQYLLRPEAIESIFILYRITGAAALQEHAWKMFEKVEQHTKTLLAHTALEDVTKANPPKGDSMESFWLAETLKYYYLLFGETDVLGLDEWVFSTEAHPFRIPR